MNRNGGTRGKLGVVVGLARPGKGVRMVVKIRGKERTEREQGWGWCAKKPRIWSLLPVPVLLGGFISNATVAEYRIS